MNNKPEIQTIHGKRAVCGIAWCGSNIKDDSLWVSKSGLSAIVFGVNEDSVSYGISTQSDADYASCEAHKFGDKFNLVLDDCHFCGAKDQAAFTLEGQLHCAIMCKWCNAVGPCSDNWQDAANFWNGDF